MGLGKSGERIHVFLSAKAAAASHTHSEAFLGKGVLKRHLRARSTVLVGGYGHAGVPSKWQVRIWRVEYNTMVITDPVSDEARIWFRRA